MVTTTSTTQSVGLDVQNNDINNCRYGFYCYAAPPSGSTPANYLFKNNDLEATYYGIYVSGSGSSSYTQPGHVLIQNNNIVCGGTSTSYGIRLQYVNSTSSNRSLVENNMIALNSTSTTSSQYGIYPYHSGNVDFFHNSVSVSNGSATSGRRIVYEQVYVYILLHCCWQRGSRTTSSPTQVEVMQQKHLALRLRERTSQQITMSTTQQALARSSTTTQLLATLAAWQTATSQDANSAFGDPLYNSATDLHAQGALANNAGTSVGTLTDIDGDSRSTIYP